MQICDWEAERVASLLHCQCHVIPQSRLITSRAAVFTARWRVEIVDGGRLVKKQSYSNQGAVGQVLVESDKLNN
jgi:hypothetical protein